MDLLCKLKSPVLRDNRKCEANGLDPTSLISSGLNFIGGLISNRTNKKLVRETNAMTRELTEKQMQLQQQQFQQQMDYQTMDWQRNRQAALEDWARDNAYNDPRAQMERYAAAGLNPFMMMSGQNAAIANTESVAGGSSPSPGSMPSVPNFAVPQDTTAQTFTSAIGQYLQAKQIGSDSRLKEEQANQLSIDNRTRNINNLVDIYKTMSEIDTQLENRKLSEAQRKNLEQERLILEDTVQTLNMTLDARIKKPKLENYLLDRNARQLSLEGDRIEIQKKIDNSLAYSERLARLHIDEQNVRVLSASVSNILAQTDLTLEQKRTQVAETAKKWIEANNIDPDTPQGKQAFDFVESQIWKNYEVRDPRGNTYTSGDYYKRRNVKKSNRRYSR